ncbi:Release factor glutamine methyltransferase [Defluviimonas aquaemixtae]|uniref:Release factor glutamine methyltransferase n=1 Tax=Albidovulum aquaemixtae TaxID=1542388 RepID=A0A2R8B5Z3_9RHOB|nr:peptide chain release factor N(5)-glutamine methyltransferase [Defluviimonas aquaemixtae]SPH18061.1 Release factor glutamine methyltransferase [Defluviimonas aquaemixtae]
MTGADALRAAVDRLGAAGVEGPQRDARRLMAHALGLTPERLTLVLDQPFGPEAAAAFESAIDKRAARQPVSQIVGRRAFYGRDFRVTRDTLDPRPETEQLVERALVRPFARVLDLGAGTGAILITLLSERPEATGLGTDICTAALAAARDNARMLGVEARSEFQQADWFSGVSGRFDLIVSNPPYIAQDEMAALAPEVREWEPPAALTDFGDGLSAYRAIAAGAKAHLLPGGAVVVEIGWQQGAAVAELFGNMGFGTVSIHPDLDGRDRIVTALP